MVADVLAAAFSSRTGGEVLIVTEDHKVLLAKKPKNASAPSNRETLLGHLSNVLDAAEALVAQVGAKALESMAISTVSLEDLRKAVLRGAFLHDLGKANHQFQRALLPGKRPPQALRHEWISAWLPLESPELDEWLFSGCTDSVRWAVLFAVLGHHLRVEDGATITCRSGSGDKQVTLHDVQQLLRAGRDKLDLPEPPTFVKGTINLLDRPLGQLRNWLLEAKEWFDEAGDETKRFVALTKALVVAADIAGSAVPKQEIDPGKWTEEVLKRLCSAGELENIALKRLNGQEPRQFQEQVAQCESNVTFLKAGCGTGKTIAAYLWASRHAAGRKLFFCYPTTGTATEGFRDYIIPGEMSAESLLLHSRSEVDLEDLLDLEEDKPLDDAIDHAIRIESLAAWDVPLIICTVDQVLGIIQNNRRPLFSFPSIANGAFVFDEIHQYDERLFAKLLRFLDAFRGAPTLLMTASLPEPRVEAIRPVLGKGGVNLEVIQGPADFEAIERYTLKGPLRQAPWDAVNQMMSQGGKILWVANTVARCVDFAQQAQSRGIQPLPYHSRYRYCDRIKRHQAVIEAFRKPEPALSVTTQVCEVSLDLSADLLITDLAPVPALIQRMGRLNRRVTPEQPGSPKQAIFLEPGSPLPYEQIHLTRARRWLRTLGFGPLSQAMLASAFEMIGQNDEVPGVKSAWLDGGPFSTQAPLREAGAVIPVVRPEDEPFCLDVRSRPLMKEITRYAIPMMLGPVAKEIGRWKRLSFVFVAPEGRIDYSEKWGARWAEK